jgi:hypothetical protein
MKILHVSQNMIDFPSNLNKKKNNFRRIFIDEESPLHPCAAVQFCDNTNVAIPTILANVAIPTFCTFS